MDELKIDQFMAEVESDMEYIRVLEHEKPALSEAQKEEIKTLPKAEQERAKKEMLDRIKQEKRERMSLLISAVEDKIKSSSLPPEAKKSLADVIDQAKDNGWKFSPQNIQQVETIIEQDMEEKKPEEKTSDDIVVSVAKGAAMGAAVMAASATMKATKKVVTQAHAYRVAPNRRPTTTVDIGDLTTLNEDAPAEKVEKVRNMGQKTLEKYKITKYEDLRFNKEVPPAQKRAALAAYVEKHPAVKKDKIAEMTKIQNIAVQKSIARHQRKLAKTDKKNSAQRPEIKHSSLTAALRNAQGVKIAQTKPVNVRPVLTPQEKIVMARVNRMKQCSKDLLTMDEIMEKLAHPALRRVYEAKMRADHPEYFAARDERARRDFEKAKLRSIRRNYRKNVKSGLKDSLTRLQQRADLEQKPRLKPRLQEAQQESDSDKPRVAVKAKKHKRKERTLAENKRTQSQRTLNEVLKKNQRKIA